MNKGYKLIILLLSVFALQSCSDLLEVQNPQALDSQKALTGKKMQGAIPSPEGGGGTINASGLLRADRLKLSP